MASAVMTAAAVVAAVGVVTSAAASMASAASAASAAFAAYVSSGCVFTYEYILFFREFCLIVCHVDLRIDSAFELISAFCYEIYYQ